MTTINPSIGVPSSQKPRTIRVKKEWRNPETLDLIEEQLKQLFPEPHGVTLTWASGGVKIVPGSKLELLKLSKRGELLEISPIVGHPRVPDDVRKSLVFLGLCAGYCQIKQARALDDQGKTRTNPPNPFEDDRLLTWIEDTIRIDKGSQFLELFFDSFWKFLNAVEL